MKKFVKRKICKKKKEILEYCKKLDLIEIIVKHLIFLEILLKKREKM